MSVCLYVFMLMLLKQTHVYGRMLDDGWMYGWMDEWMDEWMDGWMDEWVGGWI